MRHSLTYTLTLWDLSYMLGVQLTIKEYIMNIETVQILILLIATGGGLSLPYVASLIWTTTDMILSGLLIALFGTLCAFVALIGWFA